MIWKLNIEFETAAHPGSGAGLAGIIDRTVLRDHAGIPYLAGSGIKGKLRYAARRLLASGFPENEKSPCQTPDSALPCEANLCLICQIFGSPLTQGSVFFSDAYPMDPESGIIWLSRESPGRHTLGGAIGVRATAALDRSRRTARKNHLFTSEVLSPIVRFESRLEGDVAPFAAFLRACCAISDTFGAGSSRGMGFCAFTLSAEGSEDV
jgi:CRISPR/Cas system CSM-associated protein Csm3 (group 7 of RAMP superfamily)